MDLQTKQPHSLLTLILVSAATAAVVSYLANNVTAVRRVIG